jgi:hypothetical protein
VADLGALPMVVALAMDEVAVEFSVSPLTLACPR